MQEVIGYNRNSKNREKNDFYATPPEEVYNIMEKEQLYGVILDNCCGAGHITRPVKEKYPKHKVIATDLVDRGYGQGGKDFLEDNYPYTTNIDTIIMNPPFKSITPFVTKSLKIATKKVILFARLQFMESKARYNQIFKDNKPNRFYIYVNRISCGKNGDFSNTVNSMCFAWFIWDKINTNQNFYWIKS